MSWRLRNSRGDTIVEVMIAIAVVSSVLGGAYVVTNRTMQNSRQAQEHSEALQVAQQQVERIVDFAITDTDHLYDTDTTAVHCASRIDSSLQDVPDVTNPPAACTGFGLAGLYTATFTYLGAQDDPDQDVPGASHQGVFRVEVVWDSVTGAGKDKVSLVYRPYEP